MQTSHPEVFEYRVPRTIFYEIRTIGRFQDSRHQKATLLYVIQPLEAAVTAFDHFAFQNENRAELELELEELRHKGLQKSKFVHLIMDIENFDTDHTELFQQKTMDTIAQFGKNGINLSLRLGITCPTFLEI